MITETTNLVMNCRKCDHQHFFQSVNRERMLPVLRPNEAVRGEYFVCILCHENGTKTASDNVAACKKCNSYVFKDPKIVKGLTQ